MQPSLELPVAIHAAVESAHEPSFLRQAQGDFQCQHHTPPPRHRLPFASSAALPMPSTKAGQISCRRHRLFRDTDFASTLQQSVTRSYRNPRSRSQPVPMASVPRLIDVRDGLMLKPIRNGSCSPKRPKQNCRDLPTRQPADATGDSIAAAGHLVAGARAPNRRRKPASSCEEARLEVMRRPQAGLWRCPNQVRARLATDASVAESCQVFAACTRACTHQLESQCGCASMSLTSAFVSSVPACQIRG